MEKCDFGIHLKEEFHKTHFVRKNGMKIMSE